MNKKTICAAALAMLFAACTNSDETDELNGQVEANITAGFGEVATRANGSTWAEDHIGVIATAVSGTTDGLTSSMVSKYTNSEYSTTSTSTSAVFTAISNKIFFQDSKETVTFVAYAPFQSDITNGIAVDTENNNTSEKQSSIDFLYAKGVEASKSNPNIEFAFTHVMSRIQLTINPSTEDGFGEGAEISSVTLSGLKHKGTFDLTTGVIAPDDADNDAISDWDITKSYASVIVVPQGETELTLKVVIANQTYSVKVKPSLKAGASYNYNISAKKNGLTISGSTITDWTPETSDVTATMPE